MGTVGIRRCLTTLLFAGVLLSAPAQAQAPFTIAEDPNPGDPHVAIDADGDAHVLWSSHVNDGENPDHIRYCIVRRAARSCDPATLKSVHTAPTPLVSEFAEAIFTSDNFVVVIAQAAVDSNETRIYAWVSSNRGASFGAPVALTPSGAPYATPRDVVLGPGAGVSMVFVESPTPQPPDFEEVPPRVHFLYAPLAGPTPAAAADLTSKTTFVGDTGSENLALLDGIPILVRGDVDDVLNPTTPRMEYQRYDGSGDLNDPGNWTNSTPLSPTSQIPEVAGGPNGVALVYPPQELRNGEFESDPYQARVLNPGTFEFAPPVEVSGDSPGSKPYLYAQPETGTFHFIQHNTLGIVWSSSEDGRSWSAPVVAADGDHDACCGLRPRVAADASGTPLVVWADTGVNATKILGSRPATDPNIIGDELCGPPNCAPAGGKPIKSAGNKTFTSDVDVKDCGTKRVIGSVTIRRRKSATKTKVRKVVFRLDGRRRKKDRKPPYKAKYSLKGAEAGSKHTLSAVVFVTLKKAGQKATRKKLKVTKSFILCPG